SPGQFSSLQFLSERSDAQLILRSRCGTLQLVQDSAHDFVFEISHGAPLGPMRSAPDQMASERDFKQLLVVSRSAGTARRAYEYYTGLRLVLSSFLCLMHSVSNFAVKMLALLLELAAAQQPRGRDKVASVWRQKSKNS